MYFSCKLHEQQQCCLTMKNTLGKIIHANITKSLQCKLLEMKNVHRWLRITSKLYKESTNMYSNGRKYFPTVFFFFKPAFTGLLAVDHPKWRFQPIITSQISSRKARRAAAMFAPQAKAWQQSGSLVDDQPNNSALFAGDERCGTIMWDKWYIHSTLDWDTGRHSFHQSTQHCMAARWEACGNELRQGLALSAEFYY